MQEVVLNLYSFEDFCKLMKYNLVVMEVLLFSSMAPKEEPVSLGSQKGFNLLLFVT